MGVGGGVGVGVGVGAGVDVSVIEVLTRAVRIAGSRRKARRFWSGSAGVRASTERRVLRSRMTRHF